MNTDDVSGKAQHTNVVILRKDQTGHLSRSRSRLEPGHGLGTISDRSRDRVFPGVNLQSADAYR